MARSVVREVGGEFEPYWTLKTSFHWLATFPGGKPVTIQHGYRPVAGTASWTAENADRLTEAYCVDKAVAADLTQKAAAGKPQTVYLVHVEPATNSGLKGPAQTYTLSLEKPEDGSVVAACRKGLVAAGPRTLRWTASDHESEESIPGSDHRMSGRSGRHHVRSANGSRSPGGNGTSNALMVMEMIV